jgi:DNA-binding CsgD family transcriptional regulator
MRITDSYGLVLTAQEIDKLCHSFLQPRGLIFFQFKRIFKDGSCIILANRPDFFYDYLENDLPEPSPAHSMHLRQSSILFWDESLPPDRLAFINKDKGVYHGLSIISRRKIFYDCTTFAMAEHHHCPFAYYCHCMKDLQKFAEIFPKMARNYIDKSKVTRKSSAKAKQNIHRKGFFLPKRSSRIRLGEGTKEYITTYEALCVQLLQEGKSYKEIGAVLSMAPSTVETHLKRLKARTGLTLQDLTLQFFPNHTNGKRVINLEQAIDLNHLTTTEPKKKHKSDKSEK